MPGPASLTRVLSVTIGVAISAAGAAVAILALSEVEDRRRLRDVSMMAEASFTALTIRDLMVQPTGSPTSAPSVDWTDVVTRQLQQSVIQFSEAHVLVMMPGAETPAKWHVIAAVPERPEAILPMGVPAVQRALSDTTPGSKTAITSGTREPVRWYDPAGREWSSAVVPVRDQNGRQLGLVEVRAAAGVPISPALWAALGLLGVGSMVACLGVSWASRSQRLKGDTTSLSSIPGVAQTEEQLAATAAEAVIRQVRQQGEVAEMRSRIARFQGADRAKTTLLVALCRSLRQSVNSLRASSLLLAQTRIDRTQRDYVETLQAGCGDLLTRIGDVLDFALLEAECLSLEQRPLRPRVVLEEALLIVAERCVQLPIELAWHADPNVPERVIGDVARVRQVLVNLIGLAASTAEEGTVAVQLLIEHDHRLTFRISLMGVTLTAERIRLLLEGAISSDSSSDRLQGEGLGLVLGKRLAQAMGGTLGIERGEGEDIELVCTLRVTPDDIAPERPLRGRTVVVAHERPATRRMLAAILERAGAAVISATGHQDLVRCLTLAETRPTAVILGTRTAAIDDSGDSPAVLAGVRTFASSWPLILVVDPVHRGFAAELRSAGALALVASPVRQQALIAVVSDAVSGIKRDSSVHATVVHVGAMPRVLVAEDNEVNRLVMVRMLESLGIPADLAANGRDAVAQVRSAHAAQRPYSLILMDCMMPEMDGLTATRVIRHEEEREPGVWIIAVTANALAHDRMKCLDAGMNDYLAKPVTPLALQQAVNRWHQAAGLPRKTTQRLVAIDLSAATREFVSLPDGTDEPAVHHDRDLQAAVAVNFAGLKTLASLAGASALGEVVTCFIAESQKMIDEVQAAATAGDVLRLRSAAHKMKGSCGTVGLTALHDHTTLVERAAKDGNLTLARAHVAGLPEMFASSLTQLRAFRDGV